MGQISNQPIPRFDGSASLPAFSFALDTDTGMYRVGANVLGFAVNGTSVFQINTSNLIAYIPLAFANTTGIVSVANSLGTYISGGSDTSGGSLIQLFGVDHAETGAFYIKTPNAAGNANVQRVQISGKTTTATITWSNILHNKIPLTGGTQQDIYIPVAASATANTWMRITPSSNNGDVADANGAYIDIFGSAYSGHTGAIEFATPRADGAANIQRLQISGKAATATATWAAINHDFGSGTATFGGATSFSGANSEFYTDSEYNQIFFGIHNSTGFYDRNILTFRRSRGTHASPTVVTTGDWIVYHNYDAHGGSGYITGAQMLAYTYGTISSTSTPVGIQWLTMGDGETSLTSRMILQKGLQIGNGPTGADKGAGTINLTGDIYKNNTAYTNPDYVFEKAYTGNIVKYADKDGAAEYQGLMPLSELKQFVSTNYHLPGFGQNAGNGLFSGSDRVLASLEEAYLYIFELEERIKNLENRG